MFSRHRQLLWLLFFILSLCSSVEAKEGGKTALIGKRDEGTENVVAKVFESIRVDAKLPPLIRIKHRDSLEQILCTVAQVGTLGNQRPTADSTIYKTAQPESISAELNRVASFKEQPPQKNLASPRYSVAVWQVKDSQTGETQYWVGVELYLSSLEEFMDNHFTDQILYRNDWKKDVAPQCRGK
jgi:hypothetical protein